MWWSLGSALAAACCFGVAAVMQALSARAASVGTAGVSPQLVMRMLGQWRFIASLGLDFIGFLAQLIALRRLPLFVVQAAIAGSLAVTAVTAAWLANHTLAGLGYGVVGVAARILTGFSPIELIRDPAAYALAAAGIVSFMFYTAALEHGDVTVATAATVLTETVLPAIIGVIFLGDTTRRGLVGMAAAGFALAVAGALTLARFGETEPAPAAAGPREGARHMPGTQ